MKMWSSLQETGPARRVIDSALSPSAVQQDVVSTGGERRGEGVDQREGRGVGEADELGADECLAGGRTQLPMK